MLEKLKHYFLKDMLKSYKSDDFFINSGKKKKEFKYVNFPRKLNQDFYIFYFPIKQT